MATQSYTMRIDDELLTAIDSRYDERASNRSEAIRNQLSRYHSLMRAALPAWSWQELMLCCDALNGHYTTTDSADAVARHARYSIVDSAVGEGGENLIKKWELLDGDEFLQRVGALSTCELLAILDFSERFWAGKWTNSSYEEIVEKLKQ